MYPKIIAAYSNHGVNICKMVQRIIKYAPEENISGLNIIRLVDKSPDDRFFACYLKDYREIYLFVDDIIGWLPWLFKKSYIFPYLAVGLALGHEIDHHVNRENNTVDKEKSAERNALKYIYPSFGIFKPFMRLFAFMVTKGLRKAKAKMGRLRDVP